MEAAYISHHCCGRLRLKIPYKKREPAYLEEVKKTISSFEGIKSIEVNPLTASLLIFHDRESDDVIHAITSSNLFTFDEWKSTPETKNKLFSINGWKPNKSGKPGVQQRMTDMYKSIDNFLMNVTNGEINIPGVTFYSLLAIGFYQIYVGNIGMQNIPLLVVIWFMLNILWYEWNM